MNIFKDLVETRNPLITINGKTLRIIGDPHLGKIFKQGVPKDILGKREQLSFDVLYKLLTCDSNYVLVVGDLFDKFHVDPTVFYNTLQSIESAATSNPDTIFIFLNGNHDLSKEDGKISSFQLLQRYINNHQSIRNVKVILTKQEDPILKIEDAGLALGLFHYNPFESIDNEYTEDDLYIDPDIYPYRIAFGHWETIDFNSDVFIDRQVPTKVLKYFNYVITGHEHRPKLTLINNVPVLTVGSMIPYAFGEQLDKEEHVNYFTLSIKDINSVLEQDPDFFQQSCVRVLIDEDNSLEIPDFKCMSKTFKNITKQHKQKTEDESEIILDSVTSFSNSLYTFISSSEDVLKDHSDFVAELVQTFETKDYKKAK